MITRPTAALVRSVVLAVALTTVAAVLGRVDVALLSVPFIVHAAWAALTRSGRLPRDVVIEPGRVRLHEGDSSRLTVRSDPPVGGTLAAALPHDKRVHVRPASGARVGRARDALVLDVEPATWGRTSLAPPTICVVDASGSWCATAAAPSVELAVAPRTTLLEGATGVARPIGVSGGHTSAARGDGSALADVREFRPGDHLRRINWRVTSRTGTLHVNDTLTDRDTDVLVVTDTATIIGRGPSSLDLAAGAMGAIVQQYAGYGDRIGVHDLGGRIGSLPWGTGARQVRLVVDRLSRVDAAQAVRAAARPVPVPRTGTLVFFCSPLLDESALAELVRLHRLGMEVVAVDTLPDEVGRMADPGRDDPDTGFPEAWAIRRLKRSPVIRRLESVGIPVAAWRGPASLSAVLLALEHARRAPRMGSRP